MLLRLPVALWAVVRGSDASSSQDSTDVCKTPRGSLPSRDELASLQAARAFASRERRPVLPVRLREPM